MILEGGKDLENDRKWDDKKWDDENLHYNKTRAFT
jgi:hypothetical protein